MRLDGSVTNKRLIDSIISAMLEINDQLKTLKSKTVTFNELATSHIAGKPNTQLLYERAIYSAVAADINENIVHMTALVMVKNVAKNLNRL